MLKQHNSTSSSFVLPLLSYTFIVHINQLDYYAHMVHVIRKPDVMLKVYAEMPWIRWQKEAWIDLCLLDRQQYIPGMTFIRLDYEYGSQPWCANTLYYFSCTLQTSMFLAILKCQPQKWHANVLQDKISINFTNVRKLIMLITEV